MRFMIIIKASPDSEAGAMPEESMLQAMADYHETLVRAGVLLDASGLQPSSQGARIQYNGDARTVIDGPFTETKELIAGYTLIQVKSKAEAVEWARRMPNPYGPAGTGHIELRRLYELDELPQGRAVEQFRRMGVGDA